jgi:hypothetical protein
MGGGEKQRPMAFSLGKKGQVVVNRFAVGGLVNVQEFASCMAVGLGA